MQVWTAFMNSRQLDASVSLLASHPQASHPSGACRLTNRLPVAKLPSLPQPAYFNRVVLDLFKLFRLVMRLGGYEAVLAQKAWVSWH